METTNTESNNPLVALSQQMAEIVERVSPWVVAVDARPRVRTSGVIWRPGVVVSTNHTIRRDEEITVATHDHQSLIATLAGRDAGTDLAVLRIEENGTANSAVNVADDSTVKVGNLVMAVGRTNTERGVSASFGIISQVGEKWRTWRGGEIDKLIRLDLAIYLGFSGGALIDVEGRIVGINTSGLARGAGMTIPAATVNRVVDQLLARGRVARPYLGIGMNPLALPEKLREKLNLSQPTGLIILSVEPDAPADKAGLMIGDILLSIDDAHVADTDDVQASMGSKEIGAVINSRILRGGEVKDIPITLGERPSRKNQAG